MRTRFQNLRSSTALVRPAPSSGLPGQFYVNMVDRIIGFFNDAGQPVDFAYLPLVGGSLSGFLTLHADPTTNLHASTKGYSDTQDAALNTALRAYTDAQVATRLPLAGGTLTGFLTLHADPTAAAHAANRNYVDTQVATRLTQAQADARFLQLSGGTLTNFLTLHANPTAPAHAANRAYVDAQVATRLTQAQADARFLQLSGGSLTGALTLPGPPTQPLHAATKAFVEALIADVGAATHVGDTPPANPEQGQLWFRTLDPVGLFVWYIDVDSSQWVSVGGGGGGGGDTTPTEIVGSGLPSANWQVVGDMLIQWGITRVNAIPQNLTLPKAFKTLPVATGSTNNSTDVNVTVWPDRVDRLVLRTFVQTGAAAPLGLDVYWIAVGEALDADKMPKVIGTASGADFASTAEALAGIRNDVVMSPALVRARQGFVTNNLNGLGSGGFDAPAETTEFTLFFNGQVAPANGNPRILFNGADTIANSRAFSSRQRFSGTTFTSAGDDGTARDFNLDANTGNFTMVGEVHGKRDGDRMWSIRGSLRGSPTVRVDFGGMIRLGATSWPLVVALNAGVWTDTTGLKMGWRI